MRGPSLEKEGGEEEKEGGEEEKEGEVPGWIWWWKKEEREVKGDTNEGREEEAGILCPCVGPDS